MIFLEVSAIMFLTLAPAAPAQAAADGFVVCTATPTRPGSNRVALLNLSYGDEARLATLTEEYQLWLRSDASVAQVIEGVGIDPRLVRAQSKVECVWAKDQSAAEGIAVRLGNGLRADNVKVLPTRWTPKSALPSSE